MYAFANGRLYCEHRKILTIVINLDSMLTKTSRLERRKMARRLFFSLIVYVRARDVFIRIHDAIKSKWGKRGSLSIRTSRTNRIQIVSFVDVVLLKNQWIELITLSTWCRKEEKTKMKNQSHFIIKWSHPIKLSEDDRNSQENGSRERERRKSNRGLREGWNGKLLKPSFSSLFGSIHAKADACREPVARSRLQEINGKLIIVAFHSEKSNQIPIVDRRLLKFSGSPRLRSMWRRWNELLISSCQTCTEKQRWPTIISATNDATAREKSSVIDDRSSLFTEQEHRANGWIHLGYCGGEKRRMHENHRDVNRDGERERATKINRAVQYELMHYWSGEWWSFLNWINITIVSPFTERSPGCFPPVPISIAQQPRFTHFSLSAQSNPFGVLQTAHHTFELDSDVEGHRHLTLTPWSFSMEEYSFSLPMHYSFQSTILLCQLHHLPCHLDLPSEWCDDRAATAAIVRGSAREYPNSCSRWWTFEQSTVRREHETNISTRIWTGFRRIARRPARWSTEIIERTGKRQNTSRCNWSTSQYCWSSWSSVESRGHYRTRDRMTY